MEQTRKSHDRFTVFLSLACATLGALTLLLTFQNLSLKSKLAAAVGAPPPGALKIGDTLPAFDMTDAAGNRTRLAFDGQRQTLLLVFSSTCGACRETIPTWNRLLADPNVGAPHVVGIQTDLQHATGTGATLPIPDLRFPVYGSGESQGMPMSKFPAIPAAALVDGTGTVKAVWFGVPTDAQVVELRRALAG